MFERRLFYHIDWPTIVALGALCAIGVAMIYATTHAGANAGLWVKQIYAIGVGVVAFAVCLTIDYRRLADNSVVFYVGVVVLLVAVLLFGAKGGGARRWIPLPYFALQPSEFAKLGVALILAKFFDDSRRGSPSTTDLAVGAAITAVPLLLILREPDLGASITLVMILLGMAFLAGLRLRLLWHPAARRDRDRAGRLAVRADRLPEEPHRRRSSTRNRTRAAPGISRSRRASASGRAGCGARDF